MNQEAKLTINRSSYYPDRWRAYKIMLDGKEIGRNKAGEIFSSNVTAGNHRVFLKIDWCRSNFIDFTAELGSQVQLLCGSSLEGWRIIFAIIYVTFLWDRYLWIRKSV
jgi:hypothetical protein